MKVKVTVVGDTDNAAFKALQELILSEGWAFSVNPVADQPLTRPAVQKPARKKNRLMGGVTARTIYRDFLVEQGGKATIRALKARLKGMGFAEKTEAAVRSYFHRMGYVEIGGDKVALKRTPSNEELIGHRTPGGQL